MATPNLVLPELTVGQTQAETTVNLAMRELDVLVQGLVKDRDLTTPPGSPAAGDTYIPLATATGVWTGHEDDIAWFDGSAWQFKTPNEGWVFRVEDEDVRVEFDGAAWVILVSGGGGALLKVSSTTLGSAAASVTISGFDSTSRLWLVVLSKLQPVDVNKQLQMEMRLGGSFPSDFKMQFHTMVHGSAQAGYAGIAGSAAERILLSNGVITNDADFAGNLIIEIANPGATDERKTLRYRGEFWIDSTPNKIQIVVGVGGHEALSSALDAIKIRYNTGNVAAGLIADVYKYDTP